MDIEFRTCRLCQKQDNVGRLLKRGVRNYAHHSCSLERMSCMADLWGFLSLLKSHQLHDFPVMALDDWLRVIGSRRSALKILLKAIDGADQTERA